MLGKAKTRTTYPSSWWHQSTFLVSHRTASVFKLPVPLSGQGCGQGRLDPSPFLLVFHHGLVTQEQAIKDGHTRALLPILISQNSTTLAKQGKPRWLKVGELGTLSWGSPVPCEAQALGYSLREDMNSPFCLPFPETLAALLKHERNRV